MTTAAKIVPPPESYLRCKALEPLSLCSVAVQYTNITMAEDMAPPAEVHLRAVAAAEAGSPGTPADFFDALLVALDLFVKTVTGRPELATKVHKRIVLVSQGTEDTLSPTPYNALPTKP